MVRGQFDRPVIAASGRSDERVSGELVGSDRLAPAQGVLGAAVHAVAELDQPIEAQHRVGLRIVEQREIESPVQQHRVGLCRGDAGDRGMDPGMVAEHAHEHRQDVGRRQRRRRGHEDRSMKRLSVQSRHAVVEQSHRVAQARQEIPSVGVQHQVATAPVEQLDLQARLELLDGVGQRRRRYAERSRGGRQMLGLGDHAEGGQPAPELAQVTDSLHLSI